MLRNKRPADRNIGIDRSPKALSLCLEMASDKSGTFSLLEDDALTLLPKLSTMLEPKPFIEKKDTLIYADPPYVMSTRKGGNLYDFEMDNDDHARMLEMFCTARCMVMISGYRSPLYDSFLSNWQRVDYQAQTRQGMVDESLWINFKPPLELHDYSHLGSDFRERERIKRKKARWAAKIERMDRLERLAVMEALQGVGGSV